MRTDSEDAMVGGLIRLLGPLGTQLDEDQLEQVEVALAVIEDIPLSADELRHIWRRSREIYGQQ